MVIGDLEKHLQEVGLSFEVIAGPNGEAYLVIKGILIAVGSLLGRICDAAVLRSVSNT